MKNVIQHTDLSQPVYDRLKKMIKSGELAMGQKLNQEKLAAELGVSRTPLLKALNNLEHEMWVESIPRRGMYVKQITADEMIQVYECREAVECMAVRLIVEKASDNDLARLQKIFSPFMGNSRIDQKKYRKADEQFHDLIIELSENPVLQKMSNVCNIHKRVYQFGLLRPPTETLDEHTQIVEGILNRDAKIAEEAMRNHIVLSKNKLIP